MKKTYRTCLTLAVALFASVQLSYAQGTEKSVAFQTADKKYITTATGGALDLSGVKVGSKQIFTLTDKTGGDLADGDEVQVRYMPGSSAGGSPPKPNYWRETKDGLKRGGEAGTFKLKKIGDKYAFQAPSGKFIAAPEGGTGTLTLTDKQDGALQVSIVDAPAVASTSKKSDTGEKSDKANKADKGEKTDKSTEKSETE